MLANDRARQARLLKNLALCGLLSGFGLLLGGAIVGQTTVAYLGLGLLLLSMPLLFLGIRLGRPN